MSESISPRARHRARIVALQALYQWHVSQDSITEIQAMHRVNNSHYKCDWAFYAELVSGVYQHCVELDQQLSPILTYEIEKAHPIDLTALRLGAFELVHRLDIPYKVVISEYIDIAVHFGSAEGEKFVNGVLDQLTQKVRPEFVVR